MKNRAWKPCALLPGRSKQRGFSLIEISFAALVLTIGLVCILAIFPLALSWGKRSIGDTTGSGAAKTIFAYLQNYSVNVSDGFGGGLSGYMQVGIPGKGGYYCGFTVSRITPPSDSHLYLAVVQVYNQDFSSLSLSPVQKAMAEKDITGIFTQKIYNAPQNTSSGVGQAFSETVPTNPSIAIPPP
jgi:hypothetical protein